MREANLEAVTLAASSRAAGRLISELPLRTVTGAGIERNGASIVNPGPDEELQAGDQILLLGNKMQLPLPGNFLSDDNATRMRLHAPDYNSRPVLQLSRAGRGVILRPSCKRYFNAPDT